MQYYAYLWLREDGTPYYAGKGKHRRAFIKKGHCVPPPSDESRIVVQHYESEAEAFEAEKFLIAYYGRKDLETGCLCNLTDGGEGTSGCPKSPEFIEWNRIAKKGNKNRLGKFHSEETKRKISETRKAGNYSAWNAGRSWSEEEKEKMRSGCRKRPPISDETKKKLGKASKESWRNRTRIRPAEWSAKQSETMRRRWSDLSIEEKNKVRKISDEIVLEIRRLRFSGLSQKEIGKTFGVSQTLVGKIHRNEIRV